MNFYFFYFILKYKMSERSEESETESQESEDVNRILFTDIFDIKNFVKSKTFKYGKTPFNNVSEINLADVDKNIEVIIPTIVTRNTIVRHGRGCEFECVTLYKYKEYYIIFSFELIGDEDDSFDNVEEVFSISEDTKYKEKYENVKRILNDKNYVIFIHEKYFDFERDFISAKNNFVEMVHIIEAFKKFYSTDLKLAKLKYVNYVSSMF